MEQRFIAAWAKARSDAQKLGVRMRPVDDADALKQAHRILSGHRESEGFFQLTDLGKLELTLEALAVQKQFTGLFSDLEVNNALTRLLDAGYCFKK